MFRPILITAEGAILECHPAKKKSKWSDAKITVTHGWEDSTEIFSVSNFANFSNRSHLDRPNIFNFEATHSTNHFDTNLVKVHLVVIEILSFLCCVLF